ncbi:hypothetical protein DITRI_Ditri05aG0086900 [Diplodiscus trichospermus]
MCLFLGIPYPLNLETAEEVEAIVRENGVVPATIAILDGIRFEVRKTGKACPNGKKVLKRQLAGTLQMLNGATTVSAATFFAAMVGIRVFVTGGIGRVHRRGGQTMDISYDVTELGRRPVAVISAGIKSILDIARTLEYLMQTGNLISYMEYQFPSRKNTQFLEAEKNITGNAETRFLLARLASSILKR